MRCKEYLVNCEDLEIFAGRILDQIFISQLGPKLYKVLKIIISVLEQSILILLFVLFLFCFVGDRQVLF